MISPHKITKEGAEFDGYVYSKFKFGCVKSTAIMAHEMIKSFMEYDNKYNFIDQDTQVAVVGPAFKRIPSAGWLLAEYFTNQLNWYLHNKDLPIADLVKMTRTKIHEKDFGTLNLEERRAIMDEEAFSMTIDESRVKGKSLIFVDDVRITGSHENAVKRVLGTYPHDNHVFMYYAMADHGIRPSIENDLNRKYVNNFSRMIEILGHPHTMNARMVKDILRLSVEGANHLVRLMKPEIAFNIVNLAIAEGYDKFDSFKESFAVFKGIVNTEIRARAQEKLVQQL